MASNRIKGLTVEIGGDTSGLSKALTGIDKDIGQTQAKLKDINKLLKLDPTNTELLKQKQETLATAIDETKEKLTQLNSAQDTLNASLKDGTITQDQYDAWQREIIATEEELKKLESAAKSCDSSISATLTATSKKLKTAGEKISDAGEGLTKGVTAPIVAVGAASVAAWSEVDEAMDTITTKTGATGDALKELQDTAQSIATTIPTDFNTAASAVGEVSTRFGVAGDELKSLSTQFVEFANINDTDVSTSIASTQQVLSAFGLDASDAGDMLGMLTSVSQRTGVSVDDLSASLQNNGAVFRDMGLSAADSATLLGNFEAAGIDDATALQGLKKAATAFQKSGVDVNTGIRDLITSLSDGEVSTEDYNAAVSLMGSRAADARGFRPRTRSVRERPCPAWRASTRPDCRQENRGCA